MKRLLIAFLLVLLAAGLIAEGKSEASEASWPAGTVQFVVPAKAGGGTDAAARIISKALQEQMGKPFVVVNQPAGGGSVAAEQVRTAKPDGSTILFYHTSLLASYYAGLYDKSPVDEFTTCVLMPVGGSYSLCVGPDSPYNSVEELIAASKANPDKVTLGVQLKGSSHFMAGLLAKDSGSQFRVVEAGSDADKLVAVQGGQIDAAFINTPGALQYLEAGKMKILATIAGMPDRDPGAADIPSLAELGYKSAVYGLDFFILGPKEMDPAIAQQINAAFKEVLANPDVSAQFAKMRMPLTYMGFDESRQRLKDGDKKIGDTTKMLGLR